jgi:hypothetical protein
MKNKKIYYILVTILALGIVYVGFFQSNEERFLLEFKDSEYNPQESIDTLRID